MNYLFRLIKGYLISLILFLLLGIALSTLILTTDLPENANIYYGLGIMCISTMLFGSYVGRYTAKKGLLTGMLSAIFFMCTLLFCIFLAFLKTINLVFLNPIYALPILFGVIGGIIGVNVKK